MKHKHIWKKVDYPILDWCRVCGTLRYTEYVKPVVEESKGFKTTHYEQVYKYVKPKQITPEREGEC